MSPAVVIRWFAFQAIFFAFRYSQQAPIRQFLIDRKTRCGRVSMWQTAEEPG